MGFKLIKLLNTLDNLNLAIYPIEILIRNQLLRLVSFFKLKYNFYKQPLKYLNLINFICFFRVKLK